MRTLCFILLLSAWQLIDAENPKKPASAYFNICHKKQPNFDQCVIKSIRELRPSLIKGIPELDIVPMDPLHIPRMETVNDAGGFRLKVITTNITLYGLSNTKIHSFSYDDVKLTMEVNATVPFMRFQCLYELDGRILLLPVKGKGDGEFNFTDVFTQGNMKGKLEKRDGQDYLQVDEIKWNTDIKGAHVHLNNLFNGDKVLGEAANNVFNENWHDIFITYRHIAEESFAILFRDLANKVFKKFPFAELYPD